MGLMDNVSQGVADDWTLDEKVEETPNWDVFIEGVKHNTVPLTETKAHELADDLIKDGKEHVEVIAIKVDKVFITEHIIHDTEIERETLNKIRQSLEEKYKRQAQKHLYGAMISIDLAIKDLTDG